MRYSDLIRVITNYLTRMRYCTRKGKLDLISKGPQPIPDAIVGKKVAPWFSHKRRLTTKAEQKIIFGHWASSSSWTTVSSPTDSKKTIGLDTGCVWGNALTFSQVGDWQKSSDAFSLAIALNHDHDIWSVLRSLCYINRNSLIRPTDTDNMICAGKKRLSNPLALLPQRRQTQSLRRLIDRHAGPYRQPRSRPLQARYLRSHWNRRHAGANGIGRCDRASNIRCLVGQPTPAGTIDLYDHDGESVLVPVKVVVPSVQEASYCRK